MPWGRKQRTHSLLEVHLCHLTLQGRKTDSVSCFLLSGEASETPPPPKSHTASVPTIFCPAWISEDLTTGPVKVLGNQAWRSQRQSRGQGRAGGSVATGWAPTYLTIRSCGVAPCRPCLPSGRRSLDPSGTGGEAQGMVVEWAPGPLQGSLGLPHPAPKSCALRELPLWWGPSARPPKVPDTTKRPQLALSSALGAVQGRGAQPYAPNEETN